MFYLTLRDRVPKIFKKWKHKNLCISILNLSNSDKKKDFTLLNKNMVK
jgi:hypothetical protein